MSIDYKINIPVSVDQFVGVLQNSTLGERRPVEERTCMEGMIENSNLMITAWDGEDLIGIARSVTDFHYACYLSDLAVDTKYQRRGVGKKLQMLTQEQLGEHCKLILIAAPASNTYYEQIGYTRNQRCWVIEPNQRLIS